MQVKRGDALLGKPDEPWFKPFLILSFKNCLHATTSLSINWQSFDISPLCLARLAALISRGAFDMNLKLSLFVLLSNALSIINKCVAYLRVQPCDVYFKFQGCRLNGPLVS